jgi:hypothetical protein
MACRPPRSRRRRSSLVLLGRGRPGGEQAKAGTPRRAGPGGDEPDRAVAALAEEVATAQEPDGYLNTHFGWRGPEVRYSDLEWGTSCTATGT